MIKIENEMGYIIKKYNPTINKTDTSLTYSFVDTAAHAKELYFVFDQDKKCKLRSWTYTVRAYYQKTLDIIISNKASDWKQIAPNKYVSKYSEHMLFVADDKKLSIIVTRTNFTEDEYKQLLSAK